MRAVRDAPAPCTSRVRGTSLDRASSRNWSACRFIRPAYTKPGHLSIFADILFNICCSGPRPWASRAQAQAFVSMRGPKKAPSRGALLQYAWRSGGSRTTIQESHGCYLHLAPNRIRAPKKYFLADTSYYGASGMDKSSICSENCYRN